MARTVAQDDALIPSDSVAHWPLPASGVVRREALHTGGHVGFVAPTVAPGRFWAAERALRFLGGSRWHDVQDAGCGRMAGIRSSRRYALPWSSSQPSSWRVLPDASATLVSAAP